SVPAHDGAPERHALATQDARPLEEAGRRTRLRAARPHRAAREGRGVPRPALRRAAAARCHRARARHGPEAHAARRDHERARPAARERGAAARARPQRGRHDDDHRHARDELRARALDQDLLSRRRRDPRGRPAESAVRRPEGGAYPRVPQQHPRRGAHVNAFFKRLMARKRTPLTVSCILAAPLYFLSLMLVSLAIDRPTTVSWTHNGKLITHYHPTSTGLEAKIWAVALIPSALLIA